MSINNSPKIIDAIYAGREDLAIAIITDSLNQKYCQFDPEYLHDNKTILLLACEHKMPKLCLHLLSLNKTLLIYFFKLDHIDNNNKTALNYATINGLIDVVKCILKIERQLKNTDKMIDILLEDEK